MNRLAIPILLIALCAPVDAPRPMPMEPVSIDVLFSPHGGITERVVHEIECAQHEIRVQAYSFTSRPIADALIAAHKRGVSVEVCADDSNKNPDTSICDEMVDAGISVRLDSRHPISHSKFCVIDDSLVTTGSWNFSHQAEINWENELFIQSKAIAKTYLDNWSLHYNHSVALERAQ